jgi:hypothetical protein
MSVATIVGTFSVDVASQKSYTIPAGRTWLFVRRALAAIQPADFYNRPASQPSQDVTIIEIQRIRLGFLLDGGYTMQTTGNAVTLTVSPGVTGIALQDRQNDANGAQYVARKVDSLPPIPSPTEQASPTGSVNRTEPGSPPEASTTTVRCDADRCTPAIVLTGTGQFAVLLDPARLADNQAGFSITSDGCRGKRLSPGEQCTITVGFTPGSGGGHRQTTLVVHEPNITGAPVTVTLVGDQSGSSRQPATPTASVTPDISDSPPVSPTNPPLR